MSTLINRWISCMSICQDLFMNNRSIDRSINETSLGSDEWCSECIVKGEKSISSVHACRATVLPTWNALVKRTMKEKSFRHWSFFLELSFSLLFFIYSSWSTKFDFTTLFISSSSTTTTKIRECDWLQSFCWQWQMRIRFLARKSSLVKRRRRRRRRQQQRRSSLRNERGKLRLNSSSSVRRSDCLVISLMQIESICCDCWVF